MIMVRYLTVTLVLWCWSLAVTQSPDVVHFSLEEMIRAGETQAKSEGTEVQVMTGEIEFYF